MKDITKETFLSSLICPLMGWKKTFEEDVELSFGDEFRRAEGIEIGEKARECFPDGILIDDIGVNVASKKTQELMNDSNVAVIFEATFMVDGFVAKADILKRKDKGWHLIEVKASVNDKKEFIDDLAYTFMVIKKCNVDIVASSIYLVSKDFRLGVKIQSLFIEIEHTDKVLWQAEEFSSNNEVKRMLLGSTKPEAKLIFGCKTCPFFPECTGKGISNHIFDLPRLSQKKFEQLRELNIASIESLPDDFPLTEYQDRIRKCIKRREIFIAPIFKKTLNKITWPAYYLDFETVMTALPSYPNVAPYSQVVTQYSIHKCSNLGVIESHYEYLSEPTIDDRRTLAEHLINDLGGEGSIMIYSNFEISIIKSLLELFPEMSKELNALIERIFDLERLIKDNFYHFDFHGSTSIKKTMVALVPNMTYDDLEIKEGSTAMAKFACVILGKCEKKDIDTIKENLLEYCKQDTLAMVRLHQALCGYLT
jgi:hypothetical protein